MTKHTFVTPQDADHHCKQDDFCMVCEGGLALCKVCGGLEGGLSTDCPGFVLSADDLSDIHSGKIDFRNGEWVTLASPHSPYSH